MLTWNEQAHIGRCLDALARQDPEGRLGLEALVIDAASTDLTCDLVRARQAGFPFPLRLEVAGHRISVGQARNLGARLAQSPVLAFLSADAEPAPGWAARALEGTRGAKASDLVFGRQEHAPDRYGVAQAVRGLRYHFPDSPVPRRQAARYASHVNAAMRRDLLLRFPIGASRGASAVDDVLLARRAEASGHRLAYDPAMLVLHHDVDSWRAELAKARREGLGLGEHRRELGTRRAPLLWGAAVAGCGAWLAAAPGLAPAGLLAAALWAPAARRAARRRAAMPARALALGVAASPFFDLAFLLAYLRGLARSARPGKGSAGPAPAPGPAAPAGTQENWNVDP